MSDLLLSLRTLVCSTSGDVPDTDCSLVCQPNTFLTSLTANTTFYTTLLVYLARDNLQTLAPTQSGFFFFIKQEGNFFEIRLMRAATFIYYPRFSCFSQTDLIHIFVSFRLPFQPLDFQI